MGALALPVTLAKAGVHAFEFRSNLAPFIYMLVKKTPRIARRFYLQFGYSFLHHRAQLEDGQIHRDNHSAHQHAKNRHDQGLQ